jgi:hypothetical protein
MQHTFTIKLASLIIPISLINALANAGGTPPEALVHQPTDYNPLSDSSLRLEGIELSISSECVANEIEAMGTALINTVRDTLAMAEVIDKLHPKTPPLCEPPPKHNLTLRGPTGDALPVIARLDALAAPERLWAAQFSNVPQGHEYLEQLVGEGLTEIDAVISLKEQMEAKCRA